MKIHKKVFSRRIFFPKECMHVSPKLSFFNLSLAIRDELNNLITDKFRDGGFLNPFLFIGDGDTIPLSWSPPSGHFENLHL